MADVAKKVLFPEERVVNPADPVLALVDSIPALVAYIDCNMVLQYCNQPFKAWFSLQGNGSGESFPVITGNEIFSQLQRYMGKVLVGDRAHLQMSVNTASGVQYLDATLSPDFDHRGEVRGFIFHSSDITEKNRTELALKDYFENASIGIHWVNADGIIIWANPAELRMFGYSEDEYFGRHISQFHADRNLIEKILTCLASKKPIVNQEADVICKDGTIRHVTINSSVLWEGDKFIHTRCFTSDITEQKRAAQAVRESEERFRSMANLIPLVVWTTDTNGDWNFLNVRWSEATGKPTEEALRGGWEKFVHPDDRENIWQSWKNCLSDRKPFEARFRLITVSGKFKVTYVNSIPRYSPSGDFAGYIGILQDVSADEEIKSSLERIVLDRTEDLRKRNAALKKAEEQLQEKNKELEEINHHLSSFAHIASHDLQEPLRKIQTLSGLLFDMEGDKFSDKGKGLFDRIHNTSERMRSLIRDLLAYSKSNGDGQVFEEVDLNSLFNEVVGELEIQIGLKEARIENLGLPIANVIRFQFHQLFLNLLSNAIKFSKADSAPRVIVKAEVTTSEPLKFGDNALGTPHHHITISDNGIGFEPQQAQKIFEMFHRLHGRSQYEGTGIGLAICKKIIENHKGMISAEGALNEGATFHLYFPVNNN